MCSRMLAGEKDLSRNFMMVVDCKSSDSTGVIPKTSDVHLNNFLLASEEFKKGDFKTAVAVMAEYRKGIDYSRFQRNAGGRKTGSIDVSVVVVTYNRTDDFKKVPRISGKTG